MCNFRIETILKLQKINFIILNSSFENLPKVFHLQVCLNYMIVHRKQHYV